MSQQFESVKYEFTQDEIRELGKALAIEGARLDEVKGERAATLADFKARMEAIAGRQRELQSQINNGYKLVEVEIMVMYDKPAPGKKQILRLDTNSILREEPMTARELQGTFGFHEPEDESK
jgi:hypothetical protein